MSRWNRTPGRAEWSGISAPGSPETVWATLSWRRPTTCGQPADCERVQAEGYFVQPVRLPGGLRFYFPALVQAEGLTIGLCSNGEDHKKVKGAAAWLREAIAQREKKE